MPGAGGAGPYGGADLARLVFEAALRTAGRPEQGGRVVPRARMPGPEGGRDPHVLGAVVTAVVGERAWSAGLPERDVLERWSGAAGELARHVTAVGFRSEDGRLDVLPDSQAYAVQLRLAADQLIRRINAEPGRGAAVVSLRILVPGSAEAVAGVRADTEPRPATPSKPAEPSPGYRRALAALRATRPSGEGRGRTR
ncbi:DciA family protein [Streptomyces sp. NPDC002506]|uniref:DciA family protein n=1 Tax=Streptomyces sp. NPDC002506 TaxID=3154536 RepID=UPI00331A2463